MKAMPVIAHPGVAGEAEVRRLGTLYRLVASLSQAGTLHEIYETSLSSLLSVTEADRAAILLFDDDGIVRFKASRGLSPEYQAAVTGHSPWAQGAKGAQAIAVADALADPSLAAYRRVLEREGIRALIFVPLALDAGVLGKFMLYYREPHDFPGDELEIAQVIATHAALAIERKRAEIASADRQQRLEAILDNSATVILLKDLEGRYRLVNRRYEQVFQTSKTEVLGRSDFDIFPAETAEKLRANDRAVLEAGSAMIFEESLPLEDGIHTYISTKFPLQGPDGAAVGVCGIATDITERLQLEAAGRRLASIVENSDDAIVSKDLNGIITSWNKGAEHIFGYSAEEAVGMPVSLLAPPDRLDEMPEILSKVRQGQPVEHYETRRRRKDGEIIDVALTVSPLRDASGHIFGASKIARDISDRKHAEEERAVLLAREQEARRTAELLNRVGPRLASQLDPEKLAQEITHISTALVGAELGAFFQKTVGDKGEHYVLQALSGAAEHASAEALASPDAAPSPALFQGEGVVRYCDAAEDPGQGYECPLCGLLPDGLPVRSYLAAPVAPQSGEAIGWVCFAHSSPGKFTENHEAIIAGVAAQAATAMDNARLFEHSKWVQTELKRSNEELRRVNRDLEVFAYSASHDLKEPLRTVSISAQLVERSLGPRLEGEEAVFLENIGKAAKRMGVLIDDLLAYTKAARHEEGPAPMVDSKRVLDGVLETLRGPIGETGAEIVCGNLPWVAVHESRLTQLFQNLIGNAIKYRGKEVPRVSIAAAQRDGWWVFSVADNGIGIEPQYAEQIFGLFKRLHSRDEYPGSGIGLAICQRVVEQYGGRIWLERSAPGGGSVFCFSIPSRP
ncbi:MAG TPA: PAS domain S-box protein [Bryobacteraceae bacterium]|jgi:PAS domain S-box-containing protein